MHETADQNPIRTPFHDHPLESAREIFPDDDESEARGPGCGMMGLVGALVVVIALLIVALAGAAGWTAGQREAGVNATATQNVIVSEQMSHIPMDIAAGNLELLEIRLRYVATIAPNAPGFVEFVQTATALAVQLQPTATHTPSPTMEATAEPEVVITEEIAFTPSGSGSENSNLAGMLQQAQTAASAGQWADAIDWLEAIYALDPTYEATTVRQLLTSSMNSYANQLYQSNRPAQANTIVARMESLGLPLGEGLAYERSVGEMFLSAQAAAQAGDPNAVRRLQEIINLGAGGRYYTPARDELYAYYVRYGDQVANDPNMGYCPAIQYYQLAVNIYSSGSANGKLSFANNMCAQATPTPDPMLGGTPVEGVAPVGVPGS